MIPERVAAYLKYPLYRLYHLNDIQSYGGMSDAEVLAFHEEYDAGIRCGIIDALKWVRENPDAVLLNILPDLPCSNEEIHAFANKVLRSLE
jgi:hypothetical protein